MTHHALRSRRQCLVGLAGTACAALAAPRVAEASEPHKRWPAIQKSLDEFVAERLAPGAAVAVSYGSRVEPVYRNAGTLAFDSRTRFDEHSICRIASISKNVTRTAALLLVADGKITLDQPAADVLPEFRSLRVAVDFEKGVSETRPAANVMTMRHLITNTSGLANWTPASDGGDALHALYRERGITPGNFGVGLTRPGYGPQVKDLTEMVRRVAELPLAYEPGTVLNYSIGFDVMGLVIERVTGKRFDAFLHERLFGPLDMRSTGFQVAAGDVARLTTNYRVLSRDSKVPPSLGVVDAAATSDWLTRLTLLSGGGGLVSTARDFFRYGAMLLAEGALDGVRVMQPETARLIFSNLAPAGVAAPSEGVGAGTRAVLLSPMAPPGTFSAAGATGTLFWVDRVRRGIFVFLVQAMWADPVHHPFAPRLIAAVEADRGP